MDGNSWNSSFSGRLLARTGSFFLLIVVALAQILPELLAIPAALFVQGSAEFTKAQNSAAILLTWTSLLVCDILLLIWVSFYTKSPRIRLTHWLKGESLPEDAAEEIQSWRRITGLPWRYGIAAALVFIFIYILPLMGYLGFFQKASSDQLLYTLIGGVMSAAIIIPLGILIIERMTIPARQILLPKSFEAQLAGTSGAKTLTKLQVIISFLIVVSILLIAPLGYHMTVTALFHGIIGPTGVLATLRTQILIAGIAALILGLGVAYLLSSSVSNPLRQLIEVFNQVEQGNLKQRASVIAGDEVGELTLHFNHMISRLDELQENLEKQVAERTAQLRATNEVGRAASSILNSDELIIKTVNLITDRFGYYYTAIFLVDPTRRWAELKAATGTAGETLKSQKHRLEIGGKSMVGTAITTGQARIALDVGDEPVRFNNPLLPFTRSEIALPLVVGDRVIGALDVQSTQATGFHEQDIETLQGMANQVAIALENARLFQETQNSLEELRAAQRVYMSEAWSETSREHSGYEYVSENARSTGDQDLNALSVPLTLREQIIGQLRLEGLQAWTPEERGLIEAVATQTALALENARLLEESQQLALRERLIAEITGKIWSSPNVEVILQTALKELSRALRADDGTIELTLE